MEITGVELFLKALKAENVDTLFAYPGGSVIPIFDVLYKQKDIDIILPRHEQALVHAADGYARSTGKIGVCLVTSGPGATNTVTGIATANYDSVPLVCFTGQVASRLIGNDAFQEVDTVGITRPISKYSIMVQRREDLGKIIKEAFHIAGTGKKGVVVVDLPTDVMSTLGDDSYPDQVEMRSYYSNDEVDKEKLKKAFSLLKYSHRPLFLAGGGLNISGGQEAFTTLAEKMRIPVITTIMGKGAIPSDHPLYVGNLGMHGSYAANQAVMECDILFSIGTRFNDRITGKVKRFAPNAKIIHIDIEAASISRDIIVDVSITADAKKAAEEMLKTAQPMKTGEWIAKIDGWKNSHPLEMHQVNSLLPNKIIEEVNARFPGCIVVTDVGQHQMWAAQYIEMTKGRQFLTSGGLGTMGYGFPAAIGAQIGNPEKRVVCITGDGGVQMNIQELATAVCQELPVITLIFNNNYLGMVRQWQELFHDKRYSSTCLRYRKSCDVSCGNPEIPCPPYTPDFVKLAESYGAIGLRVSTEEEMKAAFDKAAQLTKQPILIECMIESEINVFPMVKSGCPLNEMILEAGE